MSFKYAKVRRNGWRASLPTTCKTLIQPGSSLLFKPELRRWSGAG